MYILSWLSIGLFSKYDDLHSYNVISVITLRINLKYVTLFFIEEIQRKYGDQKTGIYIFLIIYFVLNILSNLFELYLNFGLSNQKVVSY